MRQRGTATSRRFYNAFYRWTVLNGDPHPVTRAIPATGSLHTSQSRKYNADRVFPSKRDSKPTGGRSQPWRSLENAKPKEDEQDDLSWLDAEVRSSSERPFDTLEPWDEAIRYKSFAGVMLQLAMPSDAVSRIEDKHGPLGEMKGAKVEVGTRVGKKMDSGDTISVRSVLVTGTIKEVTALRRLIRNYGNMKGNDDTPEPHHLRPPSESYAESATVNAESEQDDVPSQQGRAAARVKPWSFKLQWGPKPQTAETLVPSRLWERIEQRVGGIQEIERRTGATVQQEAPVSKGGGGGRLYRISISGSEAQARNVLQLLRDLEVQVSAEKYQGLRQVDTEAVEGWVEKSAEARKSEVPGSKRNAVPHNRDTAARVDEPSATRRESRPSVSSHPLQLATTKYPNNRPRSQVQMSALSIPNPVNGPLVWTHVMGKLPNSPPVAKGLVSSRFAFRQMGLLVLEGSKAGIEEVKAWIQGSINEKCARDGAQRVLVREVMANEVELPAVERESGGGPQASTSDFPHWQTSVLRIPDPDGKKTIFDAVLVHLNDSKCTVRSLRSFRLCAIAGSGSQVDQAKRRIQGAVNNYCDARGIPRAIAEETWCSSAPTEDRHSAPAPFSLVLALPDSLDIQARESIIATWQSAFSGRFGSTHKGVDVEMRDGVFTLMGPALYVLNAAKALPRWINQTFRLCGMEPLPLKAAGTLTRESEGSVGVDVGAEDGDGNALYDVEKNDELFGDFLAAARSTEQISSASSTLSSPQADDSTGLQQDAVGDAVEAGEHEHGHHSNTKSKESEERQNSEQLVEDLKSALRPLTHPVVLVTSTLQKTRVEARTRSNPFNFDDWRGVTISSFNSVTLAPTPVVSFNLRIPSRSWDAMLDSGRLCIHILSASPEGAAIAHAFTQPYDSSGEPFRRLQGMGAHVWLASRLGYARVSGLHAEAETEEKKGVVCYINAELIKEKCVEIGDHVIAVAGVKSVHFPNTRQMDVEGLAYAMRGFRGLGSGIEPLEIPKLEDLETDAGTEMTSAELKSRELKAFNDVDEEADSSTVNTVDAAGSSEAESVRSQMPEHSPFADEQTLGSTPGSGFETQEVATDSNKAESTAGAGEARMTRYFEQAETDGPDETHASSTFNDQASQSPSAHKQPTGDLKRPTSQAPRLRPLLKSSFSTTSRSFTPVKNVYSNSPPDSDFQENNASNKLNNSTPASQVTDPALLTSTVSDFLNLPDEDSPPPRIRGVLRAKEAAAEASRRLEEALADGTLTPGESANLETIVARNERRVAKFVALRSAEDLQRMLDKGRVDFERAKWLETSIEKGQAVLLEEAKQLREMFEGGKVDRGAFQKVKESLEQQNQVLRTEAMRLRQIVDEEGDEGSPG